MKIIVCIKQVPDTTNIRIDPETNTLIREGVESIINPFDEYALEEGIRLQEEYGGETNALSMGPPQVENALKMPICYATGLLPARIPWPPVTPWLPASENWAARTLS